MSTFSPKVANKEQSLFAHHQCSHKLLLVVCHWRKQSLNKKTPKKRKFVKIALKFPAHAYTRTHACTHAHPPTHMHQYSIFLGQKCSHAVQISGQGRPNPQGAWIDGREFSVEFCARTFYKIAASSSLQTKGNKTFCLSKTKAPVLGCSKSLLLHRSAVP